jgi:hypothetical protein
MSNPLLSHLSQPGHSLLLLHPLFESNLLLFNGHQPALQLPPPKFHPSRDLVYLDQDHRPAISLALSVILIEVEPKSNQPQHQPSQHLLNLPVLHPILDLHPANRHSLLHRNPLLQWYKPNPNDPTLLQNSPKSHHTTPPPVNNLQPFHRIYALVWDTLNIPLRLVRPLCRRTTHRWWCRSMDMGLDTFKGGGIGPRLYIRIPISKSRKWILRRVQRCGR